MKYLLAGSGDGQAAHTLIMDQYFALGGQWKAPFEKQKNLMRFPENVGDIQ